MATGAHRVGETWQSDDADSLIAAAQPPDVDPIPLERVTPFLFEEPLAPSLAARRAGQPLTLDMLRKNTLANLAWWSEQADLALVEGVGGLLCPLAEDGTVLDLAEALDYPLLVVARFALGTLNHTLMTVRIARERGLRVCGVLLNQTDPTPLGVAGLTASEELSRFLGEVTILGEIGFQHDSTLLCPAICDVDWSQRVRSAR